MRRVDANGNAISFLYDAGGRVVRKSYPDGTADNFTYDQNNNLLTASNLNSTLTFTYDALKRTTSIADSRFPGAVLYGYDRNSRRTALTDPTGGIFAYGYDQAGHLASIANPAGGTAQFGYDAAGRSSTLAFSNGTAAVRAYDPAGHPTVLVWFSAAGSLLQWLVYGYDPNGNPLWVADAGGRHQYQYDALNRLTAAVHPALAAESYAYDAAGNRTSSASDPNYSYDNDGRVTAAEGASYTWDQNGNLTQRRDAAGATAYTYDFNNRLVSIAFPNGTTAAYKYDALGRRIEKNVSGAVTRYLYDGTNVLLELDGAGQLVARYTHGPDTDQPLIMERGRRMYYYHADANGSVLALSDSTGAAVVAYSYDSFGRPRNFDPAAQRSNPYKFAGREYDAESGLYYLRARYYDSATGRFLSHDPLDLAGLLPKPDATLLRLPQQFNLYVYAANNPLVFRDPSGLSPYHYVAQYQMPTLYVNPWNGQQNNPSLTPDPAFIMDQYFLANASEAEGFVAEYSQEGPGFTWGKVSLFWDVIKDVSGIQWINEITQTKVMFQTPKGVAGGEG
jgi:RHS repeat-associated protein